MQESNFTIEEIKVTANQLVDRVKNLIKEGRTRRVTIKKGEHVYIEIPLTVGIGGAMAVLAAVGAIAALVSDVELVIERVDEPKTTEV